MNNTRPELNIRGRRVLLVGLGLHGGGEATVRWLVAQGAQVRVTDRKTKSELSSTIKRLAGLGVRYILGRHRKKDFSWAEMIVQNPGVPVDLPGLRLAAKQGIPVLNEASLFVSIFPGQLIGVTGTRGKTTTTLLLGQIVRRARPATIVSGNLRDHPMLDYLTSRKKYTGAVLELSSFQLEKLPVLGKPFAVAVMTNLKADHLNRHGTMRRYAQTKYNIFRGQSANDYAILNAADNYCRRVPKITPAQVIWYGLGAAKYRRAVFIDRAWVREKNGPRRVRLFPLRDWPLPGGHNQENLLAAVAAARALGIAIRTIAISVRRFKNVPYRQEKIRLWRGHQYVNDTTATSPDGTLAALRVHPRAMFIIGGTDKGLNYRHLTRVMARRRLPFITLPGTATEKIMAALPTSARTLVHPASMMAPAVKLATQHARPGQTIILSPGAASFGLFIHEFDRGDQFTAVVKKLT